MQADRRHFLAHIARLAGLASLTAALPGLSKVPGSHYPFALGVASGSPLPTSVVLWTRLIADPLAEQAFSTQAITVRWEIAEDENFRRIAAKGQATAIPELAHSIHVDASGLQPDRWYWYRFMAGDAISPIARTRTAPLKETMLAAMRFAVASCQHWEFGHYAAHRHIAATNPDLVVFLGDYIYEWGPYDLAHPSAPRQRSNESMTLAHYRARYAQYKSDPHLQAAHHAAPWILTWDDHEVANDYGKDRDEILSPNFHKRRAAAYQAFYEHMPVRLFSNQASGFAQMRIYERYDWGRLAQFHVLDSRQYRSYQACPLSGRGGSTSVTAQCRERSENHRTLLGHEQEKWLDQGFATSQAKWNILAQQTLMAQHSQLPMRKPEDGRFWTDGWDGYPAARKRLFDALQRHRPANPVVISGDVHAFYAADLRPDFIRPVSTGNPVIATEFCGTSITSSSRPQLRTDRYVAENPHIQYGRSDRRGFAIVELTPAKMNVHFMGLENVLRADSKVSALASFVVEDGRPGVHRS